mmetsp:Transcript_12872/g.13912  ORF Transcript_12872/g.13912 Transcript_12872/m.13912 type:complete len:341 (+) Transcript_12872:29-1051(+)
MSMLQRLPLSSCHFTETDDLVYLQDDTVWIESRAERLEDEEKESLFKFIHQLHGMDIGAFDKKFIKLALKNYFGKAERNRLNACKRQNLVRNIFLAAIIREVILRTETSESMTKNRESFLEEFDFLQNEEGTDEELTWLNRYARALKILSRLYENEGKKTLMMGVAAHLQGSSVFTEYTTGGANKPETERRVNLHGSIANYRPKKRPPRLGKPENISEAAVKRGRGRPRKNPLSSPTESLRKTKKAKTKQIWVDELTLSYHEHAVLLSSFSFSESSDEDEDFPDFLTENSTTTKINPPYNFDDCMIGGDIDTDDHSNERGIEDWDSLALSDDLSSCDEFA